MGFVIFFLAYQPTSRSEKLKQIWIFARLFVFLHSK